MDFESELNIFSNTICFGFPEFIIFKSFLKVLLYELIERLFALKLLVLKLKLLNEFFLEIFELPKIILLLPILELVEFVAKLFVNVVLVKVPYILLILLLFKFILLILLFTLLILVL